MPWVRFWPSDWLAGTRGMSAAETGVYITLIAMMYERGEPIADDPARLARLCGTSNSHFKKALSDLIEHGKIVQTAAGLWNMRVEKEASYRLEKQAVGKQNAERRWRKSERKQPANDATAMPPQCNGNANPEARDRKKEEDPNGSSKKAVRGTRIGDFRPDLDEGVRQGLTSGQAERERDRFCDFWRSKAGRDGLKLDWPATWRNWCRSAVDRLGKRTGVGSRSPPDAPRSASQRIRDEILRQHGGGIANPPAYDGPEIDGHVERR